MNELEGEAKKGNSSIILCRSRPRMYIQGSTLIFTLRQIKLILEGSEKKRNFLSLVLNDDADCVEKRLKGTKGGSGRQQRSAITQARNGVGLM